MQLPFDRKTIVFLAVAAIALSVLSRDVTVALRIGGAALVVLALLTAFSTFVRSDGGSEFLRRRLPKPDPEAVTARRQRLIDDVASDLGVDDDPA